MACSAEEYGVSADESEPVGEDHPLRPRSPYGVSKEQLSSVVDEMA
jgi:GDP-D-mannose dehydratase